MKYIPAVLILIAALSAGTLIWAYESTILLWILYLAFFIVCAGSSTKGRKHGQERRGGS